MHRLTRREVLGGGLLLTLSAMTGCATQRGVGDDAVAKSNLELFLERKRNQGTTDPGARPLPDDWSRPGEVIARSTWTRSGVARPREIYSMGSVHRITVHHDGMPPVALRTRADVVDRIEAIRRAHVESRGFADIGYHYIVDPMGGIWEGRSIRYQGAHVRDNNPNNLGVLVLGNFEQQTPTRAATATLDRFVASQMRRYAVPLGRVHTHRELVSTACPGQTLQRYMVSTRSRGGGLTVAYDRLGAGQTIG